MIDRVTDVYAALCRAMSGTGWDVIKNKSEAEVIDYLARKLRAAEHRVEIPTWAEVIEHLVRKLRASDDRVKVLEKAVRALAGERGEP